MKGVSRTTCFVCACGALSTLALLLFHIDTILLTVPIGLPGHGLSLAVDGLSAFFLLLLFLAGTAATLRATEHAEPLTDMLLPVLIAAMALTLMAADGLTLILGFEMMSLACWAVLATRPEPEAANAALLFIGVGAFGALCLIPGFALLAPTYSVATHADASFAAIRAHPPEGWRASLAFLLVLAGAGSKAGLAPLHPWLPPAHAAAPSHVSALMSGAMTKVAIYIIIRVGFDLSGTAPPLWWCLPPLAMGIAGAVLGALRANLEGDIKVALGCSTIEHIGLITVGLGVAVAARAADLTPLATLALGGAMLHALAHALFKPLLFIAAGAVQTATQTRMLNRLGGLAQRMPLTTGCVLVGAMALAGLPPSAGFAGEWLILQSLLAAPRIGGLALQTVFAVAAALAALAIGLAAAAAVRLVGIAFLGRPRTPSTAGAEEAGPATRSALIGLAAALAIVGLVPAGGVRLSEPALHAVLGFGLEERAGPLAISTQADSPGYAAAGIALLLASGGFAAVLALRRFAVPGQRRGPVWACGFDPPPAWLPFGDPLTEYSAASFSHILRRTIGSAVLAAQETMVVPPPGDVGPAGLTLRQRDPADTLFAQIGRLRTALSERSEPLQYLTVRRALSVMFGLLVLMLALVAWLES